MEKVPRSIASWSCAGGVGGSCGSAGQLVRGAGREKTVCQNVQGLRTTVGPGCAPRLLCEGRRTSVGLPGRAQR
jgi:hypothetical protein